MKSAIKLYMKVLYFLNSGITLKVLCEGFIGPVTDLKANEKLAYDKLTSYVTIKSLR